MSKKLSYKEGGFDNRAQKVKELQGRMWKRMGGTPKDTEHLGKSRYVHIREKSPNKGDEQ